MLILPTPTPTLPYPLPGTDMTKKNADTNTIFTTITTTNTTPHFEWLSLYACKTTKPKFKGQRL